MYLYSFPASGCHFQSDGQFLTFLPLAPFLTDLYGAPKQVNNVIRQK